jgi:hypothetical protein
MSSTKLVLLVLVAVMVCVGFFSSPVAAQWGYGGFGGYGYRPWGYGMYGRPFYGGYGKNFLILTKLLCSEIFLHSYCFDISKM